MNGRGRDLSPDAPVFSEAPDQRFETITIPDLGRISCHNDKEVF